jgi:CheY-like chemotaxis protein
MSRGTVLVTDDSPDIRQILRRWLTAAGFTVVEAANGQDAVRLARQHHPSVILLDLCLPGMHGLDVAAHIRSEPALEDTPILIMSGYALQPAIRAAKTAGCYGFIAKPFDLESVTRQVIVLATPASRAVNHA